MLEERDPNINVDSPIRLRSQEDLWRRIRRAEYPPLDLPETLRVWSKAVDIS